MSTKSYSTPLIPPHGGYRQLAGYQMATIVYDLTQIFCQKFIHSPYTSNSSYKTYSRTFDQMIQAARSGKQNIAEGSTVSGTSKKTELKLIGVARASLEELVADLEDYIRQHQLSVWDKKSPRAQEVRALAYRSNKSYQTYMTYMNSPESAANCLLCLCHQTNFLLDRLLTSLENQFLKNGGFTERLYQARKQHR